MRESPMDTESRDLPLEFRVSEPRGVFHCVVPAEPGGHLHRARPRRRRGQPQRLRPDDHDALPLLQRRRSGRNLGDDGAAAHALHAEKGGTGRVGTVLDQDRSTKPGMRTRT